MRAFVADHDDVSGDDLAGLDSRERLLLGVEHARRATVERPVVAGELDRAPAGREVAVEDGDAAAGLQRRLDRNDDGLALGLDGRVGDLTERPSVDRPRVLVQEPGLLQLPGDESDATGAVHVVRVPAAPRLHVGDDRGPRRDPLEVVDRELDSEIAGDRDQVERPVRRASRRGDRGNRVLEGLARHERAGGDVVPDETDGQPPCLVRSLLLVTVTAGIPFAPNGESPRKSRIVDIVFAVN